MTASLLLLLMKQRMKSDLVLLLETAARLKINANARSAFVLYLLKVLFVLRLNLLRKNLSLYLPRPRSSDLIFFCKKKSPSDAFIALRHLQPSRN